METKGTNKNIRKKTKIRLLRQVKRNAQRLDTKGTFQMVISKSVNQIWKYKQTNIKSLSRAKKILKERKSWKRKSQKRKQFTRKRASKEWWPG